MSKKVLSDFRGKLFKPKYRTSKNDAGSYFTRGDKSTVKLGDLKNTNFESTASFRYETDKPLKSTQQLNIDYSNFENHTFFHSAVAKTNEAFTKIINEYPFDESIKKIEAFEDELTGYEKYILDSFPKNVGYLIFSGTSKGETLSNGTQINVLDADGSRISTLAKEVSNSSTLDPLLNDATFQFYINPAKKANDNQILFQKRSSLANNFTIFLTSSANISECELKFGITSGSYQNFVTTFIDKGNFSFVTADHDRLKGKLSLRVHDSENVITSVTSSNQTIFKELRYFGSDLNIATGESFRFNEQIITPQETFSGSIDEFRYYNRILTDKEVLENKNRSVSGDDNLELYYKFNEPYGTYTNNDIIFDSSVNSRTERIKNFNVLNRLTGSDVPMTAEDLNRSPVLMPEFDKITALNTRLLTTASLYDNVNPNLITRLIPQHFLREGNELEGYNSNLGNITDEFNSLKIARGSLNTQTGAQLMIKFLLTWAKHFDELKMLIDSFVLFKTVEYQDLNTIPDAFLKKLAENYGISLPQLFSQGNFDAFFNGYNFQGDDAKSGLSLFKIQNLVWRRILTDYRVYASTKGTLDNVKSIFRNVGIEPDNIFHVREYGGAKEKSLEGSKRKIKDELGFLALTGSIDNYNLSLDSLGRATAKAPYLKSTFLSSSRVEPGSPLIRGSFIKGVSNNISDGLFTSGSFDYHASYHFPTTFKHTDKQSLARIHVTGSSAPSSTEACVINLVADLKTNKINLYVNDSVSAATTHHLFLTGANLANDDIWSINFGRTSSEFFDSKLNSKYYLRASSYEPGLEPTLYYTSSLIPEQTDSVFQNVSAYNRSGSFITIGSQSFQNTSQFLNKNGGESITTNFTGFVSSINFWSKDYSSQEFLAYTKNPNSIASNKPLNNYNFLNQVSSSFQQVKIHTSGKQATTSSNSSGQIRIFDFSQRNNHISGFNFEPNKKVIKNKFLIIEKLSDTFDLNSSENKIRVRSIADPELLENNEFASTSPVYEVDPAEEVIDDMRFTLDISAMKGLNENIVDIFSDFSFLENALGKPNLLFSETYPDLIQIRKVYFENLVEKMDLNKYRSLFKWLDNAFTDIVFTSLPRNTKFLGINFIYEQHILERNKLRYLFDEIYLKSLPRDPARGNIFLSQFVGKIKKG